MQKGLGGRPGPLRVTSRGSEPSRSLLERTQEQKVLGAAGVGDYRLRPSLPFDPLYLRLGLEEEVPGH